MASKDDERAKLQAQLDALDADDGDDEVEIGLGEGKYFRGTYRRAKSLGYVKEPEADKGDSAAQSDKGEVKRFTSGRRTG